MLRRLLVSVSALAVIGTAPMAHAQSYTHFTVDTTIDYAVPTRNAVVGYALGEYGYYYIPSSPTVSLVPGGSVNGSFEVYNSSTVNISGGSVGGLDTHNSSTVNISGGSVGGLDTEGSETINISGGVVRLLYTLQSSTVNLSGGSILGSVDATDLNTINISGGSIGGSLFAFRSSVFNFYGSGLTAPLVDPNYGSFSRYSLSGTLLDGTVLTDKNLFISNNGGSAHFTLNNVPEPGALALLMGIVPGVMLLRRRKSSR